MLLRKDRLEFDTLFHVADECITGPFKTQRAFRKSEPYAYSYVWNELYRLPYTTFMAPLLNRLGIESKDIVIRKVEIVPKLPIAKRVSEPDVMVKTDKSLVLFEFKNFSPYGGEFNEEQLTKEFLAGLKEAEGKPLYLIIVTVDGGSTVKVKYRGERNPYEEIKLFSEPYLRAEDRRLRVWFSKFYKQDRVKLISWKEFFELIGKQIKNSKASASADVNEVYDRVKRRIDVFVKQRKNLYFKH